MDQQSNAMLKLLWATQEAENQRVRNLLFPEPGLPTPPGAVPGLPQLTDSVLDSTMSSSSSNSSASTSSSEDSADEFMREPPTRSKEGMRFRKRRLLSLYRTQTGKIYKIFLSRSFMSEKTLSSRASIEIIFRFL